MIFWFENSVIFPYDTVSWGNRTEGNGARHSGLSH